MIRVAILDQDGKAVVPQDMTIEDLQAAAAQARTIIRDCDQLAQMKRPKTPQVPVGVPYLS